MLVCATFLLRFVMHFAAHCYRNYSCVIMFAPESFYIPWKESLSSKKNVILDIHSLVVFYYSFRNFELTIFILIKIQ